MDKSEILRIVTNKLDEKINHLEKFIEGTRASNNDTKSSMGDKYETGREMLQQEINQLQIQLNDRLKQKQSIQKLRADSCTEVKSGALVETNWGVFYLATSVGEILFQGKKIQTVSVESPIAKAMWGKGEKEIFTLNNRQQTIQKIW